MIQRHPLTGEWVIVAPWRGLRPNAFETRGQHRSISPSDCPFCPGNEEQTPPEILRKGNGDSWTVRVVPNRYPAIDQRDRGAHEVVIESPRHQDRFENLSAEHASTVIAVYVERFRTLSRDADLRHITFFKNDGDDSGQSIGHLHSQIVGLPLLPPRAELVAKGFEREPCALCFMGQDDRLVVRRDPQFTLLVPPVPLFPYEMWIVPSQHAATFAAIVPQADMLARLMQTALGAMNRALDQPSFNWIFHNSPLPERAHFHWFLQMFPRLTLQGGFELGSGMQINIVDPRESAAELRKVLQK